MAHLAFFLGVLAASLAWSAALTAAAARARRPWLRRLLVALAVLAPPLALLPWLATTCLLAFAAKLQVNWFGPVLTVFLSAVIGGLWIVLAGLRPGDEATAAPALRWPLVGLCAAVLLAKAVAGGVLLSLDGTIVAQAPAIRSEATELMKANLPPVVTDTANAASLYEPAFAALEADPLAKGQDSLLGKAATADVRDDAVVDLLNRHAQTLSLIRAAASRDICRFARDWTRPSIDMLLPEMSSIRQAARLVQLSARRSAATGNVAEAFGDTVVLWRMGRHAAAEPILVSGLVGTAIDTMALETLAEVLPTLAPADRPRLDDPAIRDVVHVAPSFKRHFFGEEAFGTMVFATFCDGTASVDALAGLSSGGASGTPPGIFGSPLKPLLSSMHRAFLLPEDLNAYRSTMHAYQQLLVQSKAFTDTSSEAKAIEERLTTNRRGILTSLLAPALSACVRAGVQARARHEAAAVAVAATRHRIEKGRLPESAQELVPAVVPAMPVDPFSADAPLRIIRSDDALVIYSVGPNGEDEGGPSPPGVEKAQTNDDVGLRLSSGQ